MKSTTNIDVLKCYKLLFTKEGFVKNFGNYIILGIITFHIISLIYFIVKGFNLYINKIQSMTKYSSNNNNNNNTLQISKRKSKIKNINFPTKKRMKNKKIIKEKKNIHQKNETELIESNMKIKINNNKKLLLKKETKKIDKICLKDKKIHIYKKQKFNNKNNNLTYNNYELNLLNYKEALKHDKRTKINIYISLLKLKHIFLFTFFSINDYNPLIIKICIFLFGFALYLTINALFFNDSTIHKIYEDEGKYNFCYQIPYILYSTIISSTVNYIMRYLTLSETSIINYKSKKKNLDKIFFKKLICKFTFFFLFDILLLILFWFYLSCFCAVYINTQRHFISNVFVSIGISFLLFQFMSNLIPCIFRLISLKNKKSNRECIYKISQII